jgi:hypothetical protein
LTLSGASNTTGNVMVPGENYLINLVQATTPGNPTTSTNFQLNGTTITTNGVNPTVIDSGTMVNGGTNTSNGTYTNVTVSNNAAYANSVSSWQLQVDPTGSFLQLSIGGTATPEPHHALLIAAGVLGLGLFIRRRWTLRTKGLAA